MKNTRQLLLIIAAIGLLIACSKSDDFPGYDPMQNYLKNGSSESLSGTKFTPGTILQLSGSAIYKTWTVKEGLVIQDNSWACSGEFEMLDDKTFRFSFQELRTGGNAMTYIGKISASGELKFQFPAPIATFPDGTELYITDVIKSHGCVTDIWGPGINENTLYFKGFFDGSHFYAEAKFKAMVNENCPDLFNPAYNGLVDWIFAYDMSVE